MSGLLYVIISLMNPRARHYPKPTIRGVQRALKTLKLQDTDEQIGVEIVRRSLEEPIRMIVQNAGAEGSLIVEKVDPIRAPSVDAGSRPAR